VGQQAQGDLREGNCLDWLRLNSEGLRLLISSNMFE
jgi:hypothetical protein